MKKYFTLLSIIIVSSITITGVVSATSTISTDVQTDGQLSVTGTSSLLGNVAIGTTSPAYNLDIQGSGVAQINLQSKDLGLNNIDATIKLAGADAGTGGASWWTLGLFRYSSLNGLVFSSSVNNFSPLSMTSAEGNDPYAVYFNRYAPDSTTTGMIRFSLADAGNYLAYFNIGSSASSTTKGGIVVQAGNSGQTASLIDFKNSLSVLVSSIKPTGGAYFANSVGIGVTNPTASLQVATSTANATTTVTIGSSGQNKGSCLALYDAAGTAVYAYVAAGASTFTLSATSCK